MKIDRDKFANLLKTKVEKNNKIVDESIKKFIQKPKKKSQNDVLLGLISESIYDRMQEAEIKDPRLARKIDRMGELSNEIDRVKEELQRYQREYKELENELRPLIEELAEASEKALKTRKYIVTIKRQGYQRTNYKYKAAFDYLYERVNSSMKRIVDEALEANKTFSDILSSLGVQNRVDESLLLQEYAARIGGIIKKYYEIIREENELIGGYLNKMSEIVSTEEV